MYRPPIDLAAEYPYKVFPPICQRCLAETKKHWWLGNLGGLALAFFLSGCVALWFWNFDTANRQMIFGFGGIFTSIVTMTIGGLRACPYRMEPLCLHRLLFRIRFLNSDYTRKVREESERLQREAFYPINAPTIADESSALADAIADQSDTPVVIAEEENDLPDWLKEISK